MKLIINTDGASRGNPGQASYGYVIKNDSGVILHQEGKRIGITTNNIAEYTAVLEALTYVKNMNKQPVEIIIMADSELVIRQLTGFYRVKNLNLAGYFKKIKDLETGFGKIIYKHIPRKENFIADRLANIALDRPLN